MDSQNNMINLVYLFQEAENCHNIDAVLSMLADDAQFEIVGLATLVGKEQIRTILEYDIGVNTELRFFNFRPEGNTVTCQVVERNDRLRAAGFDEVLYPSCSFVFRDGLIQKLTFSPEAGAIQNLEEVMRRFLPWVQKNHPLDYSKLFTPVGRFIYNRENGERVVFLMKEWRASKRD